MILTKRVALAVMAAAILPAISAKAADYDPPVYVEQPEEYVPVEVGSGWYLRGDLAYSTNADSTNINFGLTPVTYSEKEDPIFGSIGVGYHFNNYLRAEFNLGYAPGISQSASYNANGIYADGSLDNHAWTGIVNGYIDLGTYVGFTPYVGAGAGVLQSNYEINARYVDAAQDLTFLNDQTQYSFVYTLNAGVAYEIAKNLSLDLGYQYLSAPDAEYASVESLTSWPVKSGLDYHQFKVGLRYDLW